MTEKLEQDMGNEEVSEIVLQLKTREDEWNMVLGLESIGGNAGENKAAINAYADKKTGRIIVFGNYQNISQDIRNNPKYGEITFMYNFGDASRAVIEKRKPKTPPFFEEVRGRGITPEALDNLRKAIRVYNSQM